ncbi:Gfo/Idh/MocA family protein [Thalassoglobus polymorphus]|uniref:4,5-dihydroxyphthalate dehydrogenase n=1 Tax=Thalassoglobus polymorphus TaxID=2527994 RepID=A0A517QVG4_9PLAN|nr:Gfo/Idh/MocA family oxidoreductase [Thalassoglobus polymorphus]QDT35628.1 Putative 4,5-dihydroxyphthalate dehydrogenase [Thalassoglobus polymorphus]
MPHIPRRTFLKSSALTLASPFILSTGLKGQNRAAANDRINVGIIGLGSRGFNLLNAFLADPRVQITAICDVHDLHYRDRDWGQGTLFGRIPARTKIERQYGKAYKSGSYSGLFITSDYESLCQRDGIDAVVVATPDHWHAHCTLAAIQAGKDVYCEKPVTHYFGEGQQVYKEVEKQKAVFQTGSQQRSEPLFQHAVNLVRNGVLGKIKEIEVGIPPGYDTPQGSTEVLVPPVGLDYNQWCGPSEMLPYMQARHHRWWRGHRAFGGGVLMDWIGHHNDIAHWSLDLDNDGPTVVEAVDWTFPETDVYNTPHQYTIRCEYENGVTSTIASQNELGTKWIGENGWLHVSRGKLSASEKQWKDLKYNPGKFRVQEVPSHVGNFLDCMKSRQQCLAPAETAHRSITPGHLGYVSHQLQRPLRWNAKEEVVIDDQEANKLLMAASYRKNWS